MGISRDIAGQLLLEHHGIIDNTSKVIYLFTSMTLIAYSDGSASSSGQDDGEYSSVLERCSGAICDGSQQVDVCSSTQNYEGFTLEEISRRIVRQCSDRREYNVDVGS
jgi:hypothetical protein